MANKERSTQMEKVDQNVPNITTTSSTVPVNNVKKSTKKRMRCCSPKCRKTLVFFLAVLLVTLGLLMIFTWRSTYNYIIKSELSLENENTQQFQYWKETPIPMFLEVYLFNWTNAAEFEEGKPWTTKPEFKELGPYTFSEHHSRVNISFNDNNTVSFNTIRTWHFVPEKTNGSLDDNITTLNTVALTVGNMVRNRMSLIRKAVGFLFEEKRINLTVTHTAREFLFDGYNDTLLNILRKIELKDFNIPYDKFGWFYSRNGSSSYDGNYTMNTGADDIQKLGIVTRWNQSPKVPEYPSYCGMVNGTTGELWYPVKDSKNVSLFISDTCSSLTLSANGSYTAFGLEGNSYVHTDRLFDNGTKYPEMSCFSPGERMPSGVRNVSQCKFGAPAFMSMPHFYTADPSYRDAVKGMHPDPNKHNFLMAIEPNTGLPLKVHASLQVSLYLRNIDGIKLFSNVNSTMMPVLWFKQYAAITENLADLAKTLVILPAIGNYTGFGFIGIGGLLLFIGSFITVRNVWRGTEDEEPLTQDHV
ncbi:hypothetical protein WA026_006202 [Henosepilachna vigintioctopunctata]|uniref:Protein croquemort n=1 Tax=Henosepilachna vigintioctopunctata TaxID=420089 RepID=A0AAW1TPW3_9CUCU